MKKLVLFLLLVPFVSFSQPHKNPIRLTDSSLVSKVLIVNEDGIKWKAGDVFIQDQTTPMINFAFTTKLKEVTLASCARGSDAITLVAGHGSSVGQYLEFWQNEINFQSEINIVSGDNLTLAKAIPYNFTASATVELTSAEMAIDGSGTEKEFTFAPHGLTSYDIYGISIIILTSTAGDNSKFGDLTALTNGILVGKINPILVYDSYAYNFKNNGDFSLNSFSLVYTDKGGGGKYSVEIKKDFHVTTGVVPRVLPGQSINIYIRDNLSGLTSFRVMLIGHIVVD